MFLHRLDNTMHDSDKLLHQWTSISHLLCWHEYLCERNGKGSWSNHERAQRIKVKCSQIWAISWWDLVALAHLQVEWSLFVAHTLWIYSIQSQRFHWFNFLSPLNHFRLAHDIAQIMSPILFPQLFICAIDIAILLIAIDSHVFSITSAMLAVGLFNILIPLFIYCKLSENITFDLFRSGDLFFECAWYHLPIKQQHLFIVPIQRAQRGFRLMGLGIIECSLSMFLSVRKIMRTYFLEAFFFQLTKWSNKIKISFDLNIFHFPFYSLFRLFVPQAHTFFSWSI